ncbi:hypothetical protein K438DRAFT_1991924 [Mycena galopus ATCC 62051]|nr:hypothetical protein K438DRAFT_1991924 [Mycena galopus ATCC 62051]
MLAHLAADRTLVAVLDAEILKLEQNLCALRTKKQLVLGRLYSYKYPILTLPNEIVSKIFVHFLPIYPDCPPLTGLHSPTLLTQICREWREIALGSTVLWRAISLSDTNIRFQRRAQVADKWLIRSGSRSLSVTFNEHAMDPLHATEIMSAMVPHRARWQYLRLCRFSLPHLMRGPMPQLCHLELLLEEHYSSSTQVALCEAPLLRTVVANGAALRNIILPWAQLTSLALCEVFPRECTPILRHTINLVHCELGFIGGMEDIPDVTLLSLQSLTLTAWFDFIVDDTMTGYLETLIVPELRHLRVPESFLGLNAIDSLASFVSKSGCKLQELCITSRKSVSYRAYQEAFPLTAVSLAGWARTYRPF